MPYNIRLLKMNRWGSRLLIKKIDHIGIAVEDPQAALAVFADGLGLELEETEDIASQKLRAYHLRVGESHIELLHPLDPESPVAKFLAKKGGGIHHLALAVDDIAAATEQMKAKGLQPLSEKPFIGAGGKQVLFFHPKTTGGILLEICQPAAQ
jgi:methylmalonyl-CoA/ethylmalonyl-CoA epimerase